MAFSLDALNEPIESTQVPKIGAFQPKLKPRGKKPNNTSNAAGKKIPKQLTAKVGLPSVKKENHVSSPQEPIGSQVKFPSPIVDSPVDVKPNVGAASSTLALDPVDVKLNVGAASSTLVLDPVETKLVSGTSVQEFVDTQGISSSTPPVLDSIEEAPYSVEDLLDANLITSSSHLESKPIDETSISIPSVHKSMGTEIIANFIPSALNSIEKSSHSVSLVQESVGSEIICNSIPSVSHLVVESPLLVPLGQDTVRTEIIDILIPSVSHPVEENPFLVSSTQESLSAQVVPTRSLALEKALVLSPVVEEAPHSLPSELEPSVLDTVSEQGFLFQSHAVEEVPHSIPSESEPVNTQKVPSLRIPVEKPVEQVQILDCSAQGFGDTLVDPILSFQNESPQSKEPPVVLAEAVLGIAAQDNDEFHVSHDALDDSTSSPVSDPILQHVVHINKDGKLHAGLRRSKRKAAAMPLRFMTEVGESREEAWETEVSTSSNKRCKVRDQQSLNDASESRIKHKEKIESRKVASDSIEMPRKTSENSFLNAGDLKKGRDSIAKLEDKINNQPKCRGEKMSVRKLSNGSVISDNRENASSPNTNIPPEGAAPINHSYDKKVDQCRGWRKKLKEGNAADSPPMMQNEVLEDREDVFVVNTNSFPDKEVGVADTSDNRINNESKHQGIKMKARETGNGSAVMQQEVLVENSPNAFATADDLDDQHNNKSKQQRHRRKGRMAAIRKSQEFLETENCFDPNAETPSAAVAPLNHVYDNEINQSKHLGRRMKARKAADGSGIMQHEVLNENTPNEFTTENDLDDQQNNKSKEQRQKMKGKKASYDSAKVTQEIHSAVETGENCLDTNVDTPSAALIPSNDTHDKSNRKSSRQKQKTTPLTDYLDHNNLNFVQHLEDQELNENVSEKQTQKKRKASTNGKSLESSKKKFSHSSVRRRRRVEKILLEIPEADLDPSKLTLKDLIRLAEAKERKRNKEEATKKKLQPSEAASNSNANEPSQERQEDEGDMLAPQVKIVNGQIVINEESLVVSHRDLSTDDFQTYRRVEESSSKLNYHTYMNRTPVERWSKSDTELFYKAMQQFGTDFAMIQHLFPGRTRRQVKAKFKMEEKKNPLQLADALLHKPQDHSHFEMLIDRLKISTVPAEIGNPDCKNSASTGLEDITLENSGEAHEERETDTQINSTLDIPEECEQFEEMLFKESDLKIDERNASSITHVEESNEGKEASPSPENGNNEPIAKPAKSLFSYQLGSSKPRSLFSYQL